MNEERAQELDRDRENVREQVKSASARISELARLVGAGLAALPYVFAMSESPFAKAALERHNVLILVLSLTGCMVIVLEYIQNYAAYDDSLEAFVRLKRGERPFPGGIRWRVRTIAFGLKQLVALVGVSLFGLLLFLMLVLEPMPTPKACQGPKNSMQDFHDHNLDTPKDHLVPAELSKFGQCAFRLPGPT